MTILPRSLPVRALIRAAILLCGSLVATMAFTVAPAGALVTEVGSTVAGVQPRAESLPKWQDGTIPAAEDFANPTGAPVVATSKTYAIYWDPTNHYHGDWQHVIDTFFQSMGAESGSLASVFAVDSQYTDTANQHALYKSAFQGAYTDTNAYPESGCKDPHPLQAPDLIGPIVSKLHTPVCLTDKQIREELERFIAQHGLQTGMGSIFYLLTPLGVTDCLDDGGATGHCSDYEATQESYENSFCSYHSDISPTNPVEGDPSTILYGVIPWTAGTLGDGHLTPGDSGVPAFECQDGGFDPSSKPIEQREKKKEVKKNQKTEEEEPLTQEEVEKKELKEELEGPHQEEPNQVSCPSPDGYCDTGLADLIVNQVAVEQQNIVTDPLLNAWQGQDIARYEATDECRDWFAPIEGGSVDAEEETGAGTLYNQTFMGNHYYLNSAFNLAALKLQYPAVACITGTSLDPQFTSPNTVNANEPVSFDGMESDIALDAGTSFSPLGEPTPAYPTYTWNFGDGTPEVSGVAPGAPSQNSPSASPCEAPWLAPCAASTFHSYQYGGLYTVTLTVTDVGGNVARVAHQVTVAGPAAPAPEPVPTPAGTPAGGPGASAVAPTTPGSSGNPGSSSSGPSLAAPALTASVPSKGLKAATRKGLAVTYTVNEQVAGSAQVLLEANIAKRLGITGPTATGLPAGSPRSIVIGTAVLVTTKGGKGTVHIKFSARVAKRLRNAHKVKLTLRLVARNASRQSPKVTTLLSTVVLSN